MLISCRVYNTCKESTLDGMLSRCVLTAKGGRKRRRAASIAPWNMTQAEIVGTVIECSNAASQNTSSTFYTYLNMSEEFRRGYAKYMAYAPTSSHDDQEVKSFDEDVELAMDLCRQLGKGYIGPAASLR
ncbi:uncharacterized protein [Dermacentor albipictus]|uniref:uncharacterized protein isoform X1 n=1 Tax=Dermacentor albipictus TaxID=60249 RepID=UPI0038FC0F04